MFRADLQNPFSGFCEGEESLYFFQFSLINRPDVIPVTIIFKWDLVLN
jgi:hypothetical protein